MDPFLIKMDVYIDNRFLFSVLYKMILLSLLSMHYFISKFYGKF